MDGHGGPFGASMGSTPAPPPFSWGLPGGLPSHGRAHEAPSPALPAGGRAAPLLGPARPPGDACGHGVPMKGLEAPWHGAPPPPLPAAGRGGWLRLRVFLCRQPRHTWPSGAGPGGHDGLCLNTLPHELVVPRQPAFKHWAGCSQPPYSDGHFYYY